jgi:beta-lactamase class A
MRILQTPDQPPSSSHRLIILLLLMVVLVSCSAGGLGSAPASASGSAGILACFPAAGAKRQARRPALPRALLGDALSAKIDELIRASGAETVAVAYDDLGNGKGLLINPDVSFHAASTMKVPVMMEIYRQAAAGILSLDQRIPVKNDFASIVDGSHYSLTPDSDSDQSLYTRVGQTETISELIRLMITVSSNLATNILIERVNPERVMDLMTKIGANNIRVLRGVEDGKAFQKGLNNTTTARDLMIILRRIADRRAVSAKASDAMIKIMLAQKFNEGIPAGLPRNARVSHKTGSITKINHDAAIVYPPRRKPYVVVVLTRGLEDEKLAHKLIADISRVVYDASAAHRQSCGRWSKQGTLRYRCGGRRLQNANRNLPSSRISTGAFTDVKLRQNLQVIRCIRGREAPLRTWHL